MLTITNEDCMELMARYPDGYFDLAIVDPPYGINADKGIQKNEGRFGYKKHKATNWDECAPDKTYFDALFSVSKEQIIWGANYFPQHLPPSMCWIVWDKVQRDFSFSHAELAYTSFKTKLEVFTYARGNESGFAPKAKGIYRNGLNIHPTQKPVALYKWLLEKYAKPIQDKLDRPMRILDTHLGSGSIAIACHDYGYDLTACELDPDYYNAAMKRIAQHTSQLKLI